MSDKLRLVERISADRSRSFIVSTRVDARTVADLLWFFRQKDEVIRSRSELLRLAIELFHRQLVFQGEIPEPFELTADAVRFMEGVGMATGRDGRRVERRLFSQLRHEELMIEGGQVPLRTAKPRSPLDDVARQAREFADRHGIEMIDYTCEVCEELKSAAEGYLAEHGKVCPACREKEVD